MIQRLKKSEATAFGFKVVGKVTAEDVKEFLPQIEFFIAEHKKRPIGMLVDLSDLQGTVWKARWEEIRFLQKYAQHIARVAVVGADRWEKVQAVILAGTVLVPADTRYFHSSEIQHAWVWVRTTKHAGVVPVRQIYPRGGLMEGYIPEFVDV
jgi:hypothetical protein